MDKEFINNPVEAYENLKRENERLNRCLLEALHPENKALNESIKLKERFKKRGELMLKCAKQRERLKQTLQEIKAIAERPNLYIDNFEIKTATEVGYDYAAICNELELRLHKVLDLITKAEEE